jgi:aryl-alcohol dehydrogenase-like predicted oxidoreductase
MARLHPNGATVPVDGGRSVLGHEAAPARVISCDTVRYLEVRGLRCSVIGLGGWQFGSAAWGWQAANDVEEVRAILRRAQDLGVTLVDTAGAYGGGASEQLLGEALATGGIRDHFCLATKLWPVLGTRRSVRKAIRASCARLRTPTVDLYQVHWPNPLTRRRSFAAGFAEAQDDGHVRHLGVSNHGLGRWKAFEAQAGRLVVSNQVRYNLLSRGVERELLPYAAANDRLLIAYSPLAQGVLTNRFDGGPPNDFRRFNLLFSRVNLDRAKPVLRALVEVGAGHGATPAQTALAWVVSHPNVVAIVGARSVRQLEANAAAADLRLGDDDVAALEEAADRFERETVRSAAQLGGRAIVGLARRDGAG